MLEGLRKREGGMGWDDVPNCKQSGLWGFDVALRRAVLSNAAANAAANPAPDDPTTDAAPDEAPNDEDADAGANRPTFAPVDVRVKRLPRVHVRPLEDNPRLHVRPSGKRRIQVQLLRVRRVRGGL